MEAADPFVGRARELRRLDAALRCARGGSPAAALIEGDAGIGKSALLRHFVSQLPNDVRAVRGRAHAHAGTPPYWPWIEIIGELTPVPSGEAPNVIGRLVGREPRTEGSTIDLAATMPGMAEAEQFRLFDDVTRFLIARARSQPLVVILEDLHWADPASLQLLRHAAVVAEGPMLLLATRRSGEAPNEAYPPVVDAFSRLPGFEHLQLGGLEEAEIAQLLGVLTEQPVSSAVLTVCVQRTQGNPLFVREVGMALRDVPSTQAAQLAAELVPHSARESIRNRIATLNEIDRATVVSAAILGREFSIEVLGAAGDRHPEAVLQSLERLSARRILEVGGRTGEFRFLHAIVRDAILDSLGAIERSREHARIARRLERFWQPAAAHHAATLAEHFARGFETDPSLREPLARYARLAAEAAEAALAWADAAAQYTRLLSALSQSESETEVAEILLRLGRCQRIRGDSGAAGRALLDAYRRYRAAGDAENMARAALLGSRTGVSWDSAQMIEILDEAIGANRDADERLLAFLLAHRAWEVFGFDEASNAAAAEAAALAEAHEMLPIQSELLDREAHRALHEARFDAVPELAAQRLEVAERLENWEEASHAIAEPLAAAIAGGDLRLARETGERALAYAEQCGVELWVYMDRVFLAAVASLRGDAGSMEALLAEVPVDFAALPRGMLLADVAEAQSVEDALAMMAEQRGAVPPEATQEAMRGAYLGTWARLLWRAGRLKEAAEALREWERFVATQPSGIWRIASIASVEGVVAHLGTELQIERAYNDLVAHDARCSVFGRPLDQIRGELACRLGRLATAEQHFTFGLHWAQGESCRQAKAHAHIGLATVARAQGDTVRADREAALAEECAAAGPSRPPTGGDTENPLTNREIEVVERLAHGLSNRAIGEALGISATTVATHVSSILNKTALANRTEVAAHAHRLGGKDGPPTSGHHVAR